MCRSLSRCTTVSPQSTRPRHDCLLERGCPGRPSFFGHVTSGRKEKNVHRLLQKSAPACTNKGRLLSEVSRRDGRWGATVSQTNATCLHPSPIASQQHRTCAEHQPAATGHEAPAEPFQNACSRSHLRNLGRAMERAHFFTFSLFHCSGCAAAPLRCLPPHAGQHRIRAQQTIGVLFKPQLLVSPRASI